MKIFSSQSFEIDKPREASSQPFLDQHHHNKIFSSLERNNENSDDNTIHNGSNNNIMHNNIIYNNSHNENSNESHITSCLPSQLFYSEGQDSSFNESSRG